MEGKGTEVTKLCNGVRYGGSHSIVRLRPMYLCTDNCREWEGAGGNGRQWEAMGGNICDLYTVIYPLYLFCLSVGNIPEIHRYLWLLIPSEIGLISCCV